MGARAAATVPASERARLPVPSTSRPEPASLPRGEGPSRGAHGQLLYALASIWLLLGSTWLLPMRWLPWQAPSRGTLVATVARLVASASVPAVSPPVHESAGTPRPDGTPDVGGRGRGTGADEPTVVREGATSRPGTEDRPPVSGPQRVLLFGDSMVPALAPRLADYCAHNQHELTAAVWYGSTIIFWAWQEKLDELLTETRPSYVIAALGSSELTVRDVSECEPYVRIIERKVAPRPLLWVGPPNWRDDTGVNALLERLLGADRFFRSARLSLERRADGIHPTKHAGEAWVDALARWIVGESRWPIRLDVPTTAAPPVDLRVFPPPTEWRK